MALNTSKCNHLPPLPFKGLNDWASITSTKLANMPKTKKSLLDLMLILCPPHITWYRKMLKVRTHIPDFFQILTFSIWVATLCVTLAEQCTRHHLELEACTATQILHTPTDFISVSTRFTSILTELPFHTHQSLSKIVSISACSAVDGIWPLM